MRAPILSLMLLLAPVPALRAEVQSPGPLQPDSFEPDPFEIEADSDMALAAVAHGKILPLSALMPRLLAAFPNEVLNIEIDLDPQGRIEEYEFEMLTPEGRLIEVDMDARTGEITDVSDEDPEDADDD